MWLVENADTAVTICQAHILHFCRFPGTEKFYAPLPTGYSMNIHHKVHWLSLLDIQYPMDLTGLMIWHLGRESDEI